MTFMLPLFSLKKQIISFFVCLFLIGLSITAQAQDSNHATINKVEVSYKQADDNLLIMDANSANYFPQIIVELKANTDVAILHMKLFDGETNAVVYSVNYSNNSNPIIGQNEKNLFYKDGLILHIISPNAIALKPYRFELTTEDAVGNLSETLSESH